MAQRCELPINLRFVARTLPPIKKGPHFFDCQFEVCHIVLLYAALRRASMLLEYNEFFNQFLSHSHSI